MSKSPDFELNVTPEPPARKVRWIGQDFVRNLLYSSLKTFVEKREGPERSS